MRSCCALHARGWVIVLAMNPTAYIAMFTGSSNTNNASVSVIAGSWQDGYGNEARLVLFSKPTS
jgi:hypothetical protein